MSLWHSFGDTNAPRSMINVCILLYQVNRFPVNFIAWISLDVTAGIYARLFWLLGVNAFIVTLCNFVVRWILYNVNLLSTNPLG